MSPRSIVVVAIALLAGGVLAACTPTSQSDTPVETATPTASPTEAASGDPRPTLPLTCDELVPRADAQAAVGYPVELREREGDIASPVSIAALQAGILSCVWGGEDRTDNSYDQTLTIDVLPDAVQAWDVGVWQIDDGAVVYPDGSTTSEYLCQQVFDGGTVGAVAYCDGNVLVGGYWARFHVQALVADDAAAAAVMRGLLDSLAARLADAGPATPAWVPPAGALTGAACAPWPGPEYVSSPEFVAAARAGMRRCDGEVQVAVIPAGAWAVPLIDGRRPSYSITLAPVEVPGTDAAQAGCGDGCMAIVAVHGSALALSADVYTLDEFLPLLPSAIETVVAGG